MKTVLKIIAWYRAYTENADPAASVANTIAMVVGSNTPFYPLYMALLLGWHMFLPGLLTALGTPLFLLIPWLSRRSSLAGRLALPLVGTLNTLWCLKLLGPASEVGLFIVPCIILSALLFRRDERLLCLGMASLALLVHFIPAHFIGAPLITLTPGEAAHMAILNTASVMTLSWVLAVQIAGLLRQPGR